MENQVPRRSVGREPLDDRQEENDRNFFEYKNNEGHSTENAFLDATKPPRDEPNPPYLIIGILSRKMTKSFTCN